MNAISLEPPGLARARDVLQRAGLTPTLARRRALAAEALALRAAHAGARDAAAAGRLAGRFFQVEEQLCDLDAALRHDLGAILPEQVALRMAGDVELLVARWLRATRADATLALRPVIAREAADLLRRLTACWLPDWSPTIYDEVATAAFESLGSGGFASPRVEPGDGAAPSFGRDPLLGYAPISRRLLVRNALRAADRRALTFCAAAAARESAAWSVTVDAFTSLYLQPARCQAAFTHEQHRTADLGLPLAQLAEATARVLDVFPPCAVRFELSALRMMSTAPPALISHALRRLRSAADRAFGDLGALFRPAPIASAQSPLDQGGAGAALDGLVRRSAQLAELEERLPSDNAQGSFWDRYRRTELTPEKLVQKLVEARRAWTVDAFARELGWLEDHVVDQAAHDTALAVSIAFSRLDQALLGLRAAWMPTGAYGVANQVEAQRELSRLELALRAHLGVRGGDVLACIVARLTRDAAPHAAPGPDGFVETAAQRLAHTSFAALARERATLVAERDARAAQARQLDGLVGDWDRVNIFYDTSAERGRDAARRESQAAAERLAEVEIALRATVAGAAPDLPLLGLLLDLDALRAAIIALRVIDARENVPAHLDGLPRVNTTYAPVHRALRSPALCGDHPLLVLDRWASDRLARGG